MTKAAVKVKKSATSSSAKQAATAPKKGGTVTKKASTKQAPAAKATSKKSTTKKAAAVKLTEVSDIPVDLSEEEDTPVVVPPAPKKSTKKASSTAKPAEVAPVAEVPVETGNDDGSDGDGADGLRPPPSLKDLALHSNEYPPLSDAILQYCLPKVPGQAFTQAQLPWDFIEKNDTFENSRESVGSTRTLEDGIVSLGLEAPLVVWRHHLNSAVDLGWGLVEDRFFLISGFRRYHSLASLRATDLASFEQHYPRIPVHIFEGQLLQAMSHNISENGNRKNPSPIDFGRYIAKLRDHGLKSKEIAERSGLTESWVSQCYSLATSEDVSPKVRESLHLGVIDKDTARALSKNPILEQDKWIGELDHLIQTGQTGKVKEKKAKAKSEGDVFRTRKEIKKQLAYYQAIDLSDTEERANAFAVGLTDAQRADFQEILMATHVFGIVKFGLWTVGNDVDWDAPTQPFVIDPETGELVHGPIAD